MDRPWAELVLTCFDAPDARGRCHFWPCLLSWSSLGVNFVDQEALRRLKKRLSWRARAPVSLRMRLLPVVQSPGLKLPFRAPRGPPDPFAPPCIRQRARPFTAACRQGVPALVLAPQREALAIFVSRRSMSACLTAAALLGALLQPREIQYPLQVELPAYLKDYCATLLRHPAAEWAVGIYRLHRGSAKVARRAQQR
jgi:hypothetical protein